MYRTVRVYCEYTRIPKFHFAKQNGFSNRKQNVTVFDALTHNYLRSSDCTHSMNYMNSTNPYIGHDALAKRRRVRMRHKERKLDTPKYSLLNLSNAQQPATTMRIYSAILAAALFCFANAESDSKRALQLKVATPDSRVLLSSVDNFSTNRNLRTVATVEEDEDSDDNVTDESEEEEEEDSEEERGLPGTSLSAIESLTTKADTAVSAAARAAALKASKAAEATKVKEWLTAATPVDDVFMKLKLNGAGDDLFKEPNLALWLHYAEQFDDVTRAKTSSVISTLLPRYGNEQLLKLITAAKFGGPGPAVLSLDMTHNLLVKWATQGISTRQVSKWMHNVGYEVRVRPSYIDEVVAKYDDMYAVIRHLPAGH